MNQAEARDIVLKFTAKSLRDLTEPRAKKALGLQDKDVEKVIKECMKLATMLDKRRRTSEPEAGQPVPEGRADNIPEDPNPAAKGDEAAAAGQHEPEAG